ncbi:hypothetical protein GOV09_02310 [Candidatus Woesearchaeota archaeon]|nr:hypothetical protein [Candidatus Woesearchaeota archaeon]
MSFFTILLFFIYAYGLGFSASFFLKKQDIIERHIMRIGIGLGVLAFLVVLLDFLHIMLDWRIILLLSIIGPLVMAFKNYKNFKLHAFILKKSHIYFLIVLLIFGATLFMYTKGAFVYPYLEDDDPWAHAVGAKYVAVEKKIDDPHDQFFYILPYPPAFDAILGILHQTSASLMWTLKFFNALFISLGILFFYFFAKHFLQSSKALYATIALAMVPSYLSHFIWAHSLVTTLFIVSLYCLVQIEKDKRWMYPTMMVIAGIALTQPTQPIKYAFMYGIFFIVRWIMNRKFSLPHFTAIAGGYLLSLIWWAWNWKQIIFKGSDGAVDVSSGGFNLWQALKKAFPPGSGTATRIYTFDDFFVAKSANMINNPIGLGVVITLLALFSIILIAFTFKSMNKDKKTKTLIIILWSLFTFLGINSLTFNLPFGLFAFRFWMLFALPLSLLAAEGFSFLVRLGRQFKIPQFVTIIILIILLWQTSGMQKYAVNTAQWPPGVGWTSNEEIQGYIWLGQLPVGTKVFAYSYDEHLIGMDKFSCLWCDDVVAFRKEILYKNASELSQFLKENEYEYLVVDGSSFNFLSRTFGENVTQELLSQRIEEIGTSPQFPVAFQTAGAIIFRVV